MHQKRQTTTTKLPIPRKGTKYVVRASSHLKDSVPVVIAVRDMLHLAQNTKEVKQMIKNKLLKINHKPVKNYKESIKLFNIFEADKPYHLTLSETKRFILSEAKDTSKRLTKVIRKSLLKGNKIQITLHDGTTILSPEKSIKVNDTIYLDSKNKISSHVPPSEKKEVFVMSGKYMGQFGRIKSLNNSQATISFEDKETTLPIKNLITI